MTQAEITSPAPPRQSRFHLGWVFPILTSPRGSLELIIQGTVASWGAPILLISLLALLNVLTGTGITQDAMTGGQVTLPPNFQYFTPEQQAQLEEALSISSGPVFTYVFPIGLALLKVWAGWLIIGVGLYLLLTIVGGRGSNLSVMNLVAWAGLPFAVRDFVRVVYMLFSNEVIQYPGLSGFAPSEAGTANLFIAELLHQVDLFWIWHIALLIIGIRLYRDLSPIKGMTCVLIIQLLGMLIQVLPGLLAVQLSGLTIVRPFF